MNDITITTVTTPAPDGGDKGQKKMDLLDNRVMGAVGLRVDSTQVAGWKDKFKEALKKGLDGDTWEDAEFMDDVRQATLQGAHPAALLFFWCLVTFIAVFFIWAGLAPLDEVTHGQGTVIPSGKVQEVGSQDGGVVAAIYVKAGEIVEPNQTLVRLDNTVAVAGVGEKDARRYYLQAQIIRLNAELGAKSGDSDADSEENGVSGTVPALVSVDAAGNPVFPDDMKQKVPTIVADAQRQYESRKAELESTSGVLKERVQEKQEELTDARNKAGSLQQSYKLAKQQLDMTTPYLDKGAVSKMDVLKLQTSVVDAQKELNTANQGIPAAGAALREAQNALNEGVLKFKNEDHDELAKAKDEYARLGQSVQADQNKADRTVLKSPIRAEVKQLLVNTVGQAVQAGANIVELVPLEEKLLVEAKLKPQDVAFIRPGMKAMVKLSAYDFSIYGGLPARVESISPDSFTETEAGRQVTYFKINVRTDRNYLEHNGKKLAISSGMVATVDVLTGQRTVLQYLLKPINKARENAFSER